MENSDVGLTKFYIEFRHPTENKVLWHYYIMAKTEELAKEYATKRFATEQADGILLDTGGLITITCEEAE